MFLGIDFGTSGARACVIAPVGEIEALERVDFGRPQHHEAAGTWREALFQVIAAIPAGLRRRLAALALDGTSGTVLACDAALDPLHPPLVYDDARAGGEAGAVARIAGPDHPAAAATSGLAKVLWLKRRLGPDRARIYLNQADWLTALLSGRMGYTDYHNALKMGYDPEALAWPRWMEPLDITGRLPEVVAPGTPLARIAAPHARALGVNTDCLVRAGTTDSIAAFLAAGVRKPGEAVTSLGSTLVLKLVSERRVESGAYGVYSHWFGGLWLAGGASNAGGGVLRRFFDDARLAELSAGIDPNRDTGLDYYPLPVPGERFPHNDPHMPPRLAPRPADEGEFLQGLLEGLARIEALGYRRLQELGATPLTRVSTCGGGAANAAYTRLRERLLGVPVETAAVQEAAYGTALLARDGTERLGGNDDGR
jgi:sugar (pentulose or hexulose) kinase